LIDRSKFEPAIGQYLWEPSETEILRCKGKFFANNDDGVPAEYLLQGVGEMFEFREVRVLVQDENPTEHRFLFVGRNIEAAAMQTMVKSCI